MNKLKDILGEPIPYGGWHITVGQSFYRDKISQEIINLYNNESEKGIDMTKINDIKSHELNCFENWTIIKNKFKDLMKFSESSMGCSVGYYKGKKDHISLTFNTDINAMIKNIQDCHDHEQDPLGAQLY